jgi:hypothetical protein
LQCCQRGLGRDRQNRAIDFAFDRGNRLVGLQALNLLPPRIDRIDAAGKTRIEQILDRPSAKPPLVARRTDDRHGLRREQGIEAVGFSHTLSLAGFVQCSNARDRVSMYMLGPEPMACAMNSSA